MWRHHLKLNFVVFLWSFTAILGQWIAMPRLELVFLRTLLAGGFLYVLWRGCCRHAARAPIWPRLPGRLLANGALVGLHWVLFFSSAALNASVCLAGYATTTLWTALLEPVLTRSSWNRLEVVLGGVIAGALVWIAHADATHFPALMLGLGSAVTAALFSILNGMWARGEDPVGVTVLEMAGASGFCLLAAGLRSWMEGASLALLPKAAGDWVWIVFLALVCTAYAYVAYIQLLEHLSVFTINLASNFEPIYGMILAAILLGEAEDLSLSFYAGSTVILVAVLVHTGITSRRGRLA